MSSFARWPRDGNPRARRRRNPRSSLRFMKRLEQWIRRRARGPGRHAASAGLAAALLAGCAIGPDYHRPATSAPGDFRFLAGQATNSFADLPWWEVFKDPILLDLIQTAVASNHDLRGAVARVEQARNLAAASRGPLLPGIGYGGGIGRGRNALLENRET